MTTTRRTFLQAAALAGAAWSCSSTKQGESKAPRRVLVLGGTRFIGPHIVDAMLARGWTVTLFNRGQTNTELFPTLEKLRGDRGGDLAPLRGRTWDAVVDTFTENPAFVRASAELLAPNVEQYVFVSSMNAVADLSRPNLDETAKESEPPPEGTKLSNEAFGGLKVACERAAEAAFPGRATRIRPGLIVGPRDGSDRFTYRPVRVARGGEVLAPGKPSDPTQFVDVRDLGEFVATTIERRAMGVYHALGPKDGMPVGELLETCKRVSASDATFTWVPADFLAQHQVAPWRDMPAWIPNSTSEEGFGTANVAKAIAAGLRFRPLEITVRDTLAWWKTLPPERQKLRTGISSERETEVLAAWRAR